MIDFAALTLPASPNTYLVAPPGLCRAAQPHAKAPVFNHPAEKVRDAFDRVALASPRVVRLTPDRGALQQDYVQRSALFRFPDTITVQFIPLSETTSTLAVYSRSKVGYSDLGVNQARVESWLSGVATQLAAG